MIALAPTLDDAALAAVVREAVQVFRRAVDPRLSVLLDAFFAARGLDVDAAPLANFTRTSQPVVHLPVWTARALLARGAALPDTALGAAVEAAVFGYLGAQVEDDGLEDRLGPPAGWVLLAHALFARHHAALVSAAGADPGFWSRCTALWLRYAGAVTALSGAGPERGAERAMALNRSAPLVLPAAALLARAGRMDLLGPLEEMVRCSTDAAQLFDDLHDASEDLRRGRMTYVVRAMGGEEGVGTLRRRLYFEGGVEAVIDEALAALAKAVEAAEVLEMSDAAASFAADAARVSAARRGLLDAMEETIFSEARP